MEAEFVEKLKRLHAFCVENDLTLDTEPDQYDGISIESGGRVLYVESLGPSGWRANRSVVEWRATGLPGRGPFEG